MQIDTRVFIRIVEEAKQESRQVKAAAEVAIADLMATETPRFGCFSRDYVDGCAREWLNSRLKQTA